MFNAESLQKKWAPVLNHDGLPEIKDSYRKSVTATVSYTHLRAHETREDLVLRGGR